MLRRWNRFISTVVVLTLVGGANVVGASQGPVAQAAGKTTPTKPGKPKGALPPPPPSGNWYGSSVAGSGAAPWETFTSIGLGGDLSLDANVANGNLLVNMGGLSVPGVNGLDQSADLTWNSFSHSAGEASGNGWLMSMSRDPGLLLGTTSATFYDESGHGWVFQEPSSCSFTTPAGIDATLICYAGYYVLIDYSTYFEYWFNSHGYLVYLHNNEGNNIAFTYNTAGNLVTQVTNTEGQVTTLSYDGLSNLTQVQDSAGRVWKYAHDAAGNLTSVTDAASHVTTFGYDGNYDLTKITDPRGNVTLLTYAGSPVITKIVRVTNSSTNTGPTWSFSYGSGVTYVTDPNNHRTTYSYDGSNRVTSTQYPDNTTEQTAWTADNHVSSDRLPSGAATSYSYDGNNSLTQVLLPTGAHANWAYANASFPTFPSSFTDTQGNTTSFGYTSGGLLNSTTDALGHSATLTYNSNGTVASSTDESGRVTSYGYTSSGLPNSTTYPSPLGATSSTYNSYDLPASDTDGKGQTSSYSYDALGQLTSTAYKNSSGTVTATIGYGYDANGNQTSLTDPGSAGTTTYSYNALDQVTKKTLPSGASISYGWDGVDNLTSKTDGAGTVGYAYDVNDQLSSVTAPSGGKSTYTYDNDGNLTQLVYPNGVQQTMTYDSAGQLTKIAAINNLGAQLDSFSYSYTNPANGQPTTQRYSMTDVSGNTTSYTYDSLNRLTQALEKNGAGTQLASYAYVYDPVGNMTSKTVNGATISMSFNAADEMTSSGSTTFGYDANGNVTSNSSGGSASYNTLDQSTNFAGPGVSVNMSYSGAGQSERTSDSTNSWQYDETGVGAETNSSGTTYFQSSPDGQVLSERLPSGSYYYYLYDGLGSVVGLTDSTGKLVDSYSYDPYGNFTSASVQVANPFGFTGAIYDVSTGLYKMGERYYDASSGRFTQEDPLGEGYGYAQSDPSNLVDPSGTSTVACGDCLKLGGRSGPWSLGNPVQAAATVAAGLAGWLLGRFTKHHHGRNSKSFRGGKQKARDRDFGIRDEEFWKWFHRDGKKDFGEITSKEEADEIYKTWEEEGRPHAK